MKERINYIDVAKGIAIILVVYGHAAAQLKGTTFYEEHLHFQTNIIFSFVMPIFFMISGSFQRARLETLTFSHRNYLDKIFKSILFPFYSLSIIFLLINLSLKNIIKAPSFGDMLIALLIQQSNGDMLPSGVLWFLFTLFVFSLTTYLCFNVLKINPLILIIVAVLLNSYLNIYSNYCYFSFDKFSKFFIFYMFGYCFNGLITKSPFSEIMHLFAILICYMLTMIMSGNYIVNYFDTSLISEIISTFGIAGILGSLFIIGVSFNLSTKFKDGVFVKILTYYGAYSILVYVFHMPTFTIFKKIATNLSLDPNYSKQLILFFPGLLLPLVYGKLLSHCKLIYRGLLGRNP